MKKTKDFIPIAYPDLTGNEKKYLNRALDTTWISSKGEYIDKFEASFARYISSKYAVSTSNGTTALHLALTALRIGVGDKVIVPDLTFVASANTVRFTGAEPIFVDVDRKSGCLDPGKLEEKITPKTKAIMPVHLYGIPADMEKILEVSKHYNLTVIEDAAEAHGARVKITHQGKAIWKIVGSLGEVGCFSFYGNKIITTGEGGMVTTDNKELYLQMRMLRDHGQDPQKRYFHPIIGFNYRMTNLQAALGCAQLEKIEEFLKFKDKLSRRYKSILSDVPGLHFLETNYQARSVCWLLPLLVDKPYPEKRNDLMDRLEKMGVETRPFFWPVSLLPPYQRQENFPNARYLSQHGLNLPSGYNIKNNDIDYICRLIKNP